MVEPTFKNYPLAATGTGEDPAGRWVLVVESGQQRPSTVSVRLAAEGSYRFVRAKLDALLDGDGGGVVKVAIGDKIVAVGDDTVVLVSLGGNVWTRVTMAQLRREVS